MRQPVVLALVVAVVAAVLGVGAIFNAVFTLRNRQRMSATYKTLGGPFYSGAQIGCGVALILLGIGLAIVVAVFRG
jgi:hypothetical protein